MEELFKSIEEDTIEKSIDLINNINIDFTATNSNKCTIFLASVIKGNKAIIELLIEKGANIEEKDDNGYTILHSLVICGTIETMSLLIEKGANIEAKNYWGYTPLHYTAIYGNLRTTSILIEKGAKLNEKNIYNKTPYDLSRNEETCSIIKSAIIKEQNQKYKEQNQKNYKTLCTLLTNPKNSKIPSKSSVSKPSTKKSNPHTFH